MPISSNISSELWVCCPALTAGHLEQKAGSKDISHSSGLLTAQQKVTSSHLWADYCFKETNKKTQANPKPPSGSESATAWVTHAQRVPNSTESCTTNLSLCSSRPASPHLHPKTSDEPSQRCEGLNQKYASNASVGTDILGGGGGEEYIN